MQYSFKDNVLKSAVIKADIYYLNSLPKDKDIDYQFSHRFEKMMKKLIRQVNKMNTLRKLIRWYKKSNSSC